MRTSLRASIAIVVAIGALVVASIASASTQPPQSQPEISRPSQGSGSPGSPGTVCAIQHPDCGDIQIGSGDTGNLPPARPQIVEPRPGMENVRPSAFDTATIGADDRTLTITFWSGVEPCAVLDHVDVDYGDDAVTVTLFQGSDPNAGDVACIEIAVLKQVTITLDQTLADRDVVDGAA